MEDNLVVKVTRVICAHGVVDTEILSQIAGLDRSVAERVIGALLSSGYITEARPGAGICAACPLSAWCDNQKSQGSFKVYVLSDKLRRLCESRAKS